MEIIIGLPCSGKTYLCKEFSDKGYLVFDDFIFNFYNGELLLALQALERKEKVCVSDPRLCNYDTFLKYISQFEEYIDRKEIHLTIYENNPQLCLDNLRLRNDGRSKIAESINYLSSIYDTSNYQDYEKMIIPVFS